MMDAILDAVFYGALGALASFMMDVVLDAVFFFSLATLYDDDCHPSHRLLQ